ncbi:nucleoside recognition domain-containing protein [Abyssisolibacter fermentans]|uniref:nucleoside recognition domain-containing protein n=1 Tax=Abyssisolibacter fermentans TaxID=1766203 RepID=UPI0008361785|nr:nucleoside recognition domain-containing protein [Abyssisolibacter fermentans]
MINQIWFFLIFIGILTALATGNINCINEVILNDTQEAVKFAISLTGIMAMWLGVMNIAKKSGLIDSLCKLLKPITKFLFPDIPNNHPAISLIIMNMITNMFGAGNSATALGIKAMEEMNKLNPYKKRATNAMCMFLVINMSSIQLVPLTVLKIRADAGATNPTEIISTALIATTASTLIGIISVKIMEKRR